MKLNETEISKILPSSLQADENVVHTSKAVTDSVNNVTAETVNELIMSRIDELPEPVVNSLAWQLHVDTYSEDLDIAQKRGLVKNAIKDHKYKGTSWAVKKRKLTFVPVQNVSLCRHPLKTIHLCSL